MLLSILKERKWLKLSRDTSWDRTLFPMQHERKYKNARTSKYSPQNDHVLYSYLVKEIICKAPQHFSVLYSYIKTWLKTPLTEPFKIFKTFRLGFFLNNDLKFKPCKRLHLLCVPNFYLRFDLRPIVEKLRIY